MSAEKPFGDSALDRMVAGAHRLRIYGRSVHPYFLASDVGVAGIVALAALLSTRVERPPFHLVRFLIAFAAMQLGYAGFLRAKAHFFGVRSRSFLQDSLLFVLPLYLCTSVLVGNSLATSLDMAGLGLPLGLSCIRVGCFLSGCCYGRPFTRGVLYPASLLKPVTGWRSFTPGAVPSGRVFPIQLLESWVNTLAFAVLLAWWWSSERASGLVLPCYLLFYGVWRLTSDFWRSASVRPKRAGLSEAQWLSIIVILGSAAFLLFGGAQ